MKPLQGQHALVTGANRGIGAAIVRHLAKTAQGGEVVCVFSNGGFDGIHGKLLATLGRP